MKKRNIALAIGTTALVGYGALIKYYYDYCFKRGEEKEGMEEGTDFYQPYQDGMKYVNAVEKKIVEITSNDGLKLSGYYFDHQSDKTVILAHGYRMSAFKEYAAYIQFIHEAGYNILAIDQRAHGKSEGKWIDYGYNERYDLLDWSKFIQENYPCSSLYYYGISMGAATVLTASGEEIDQYHVKAIIADCGYDTLEKEVKAVMKNMKLPGFVFYGPTNMIHKIRAGHSIGEIRPIDGVAKTKTPILFIHGTEDTFVPTPMVYSLYKACKSEKELYLVKDAKHACSHIVEKEEYERRVLSFLKDHQ